MLRACALVLLCGVPVASPALVSPSVACSWLLPCDTPGSGAVGRGLQPEDAVAVFARSCGSVCNKPPTHTKTASTFSDYDARLAGKHFDGRNTLAHAEDALGFYVFGLACSCYLARTSVPNISFRLGADLVAGVKALQCAKPHELPEYRARVLSVLAGFERVHGTMTASLDGAVQWAKPDALELLQSLATSDGSWPDELLDCLQKREQDIDAVRAQLKALLAMAPGRRYRANKLPTHLHGLTLEGQLDLHRQPDRPLVASSEDDEDWGSPPSSPRVTPALVARLSAWIASSSQFPTTASV